MYYLWIDPWVRKLWYAVIDSNMWIVDAWILLNEKKNLKREDNYDRMIDIQNFFEDLLQKYSIQSVGIEKLFFTKFNQWNAEFVYWIRWSLIILLRKYNIKINEYTPIELKKNITGNWKAEKILVQNYIKKIFWLKNLPEYDDAADALWLAYLAKINSK